MSPFDMGLMQMMAASNPAMFGQSMATLGISPEMFAASQQFPSPDPLGAAIMGTPPQGQAPATTAGWGATVTPEGAAASGFNPSTMLSGLQGVSAQQPKPFMQAGVSGSQPAPGMKVQQGQGALAAEIMKLISGGGGAQNPLRVPGLGSMIKGGTYG